MRAIGKAILGLTALGLGLAALPASATTRCVNVTGSGGCFGNIQAAVDVSASGDTISIGTGTYYGAGTNGSLGPVNPTVNILPAASGLKIIGVGNVILDPEFKTGSSYDAIDVNANSVSISNITIRNGRSYGIRAASGVTGLALSSVKILGPASSCVYLTNGNTGSTFTLSTFRGCDTGIEYNSSNNVSITSNIFEFVNYAVYGGGATPIITGNKSGPGNSTAFYVYNADGAQVGNNTVYSSYNYGIEVGGNNATVTANTISTTDGTGIYTFGDGTLIQDNIITNPYSDGIDAYGKNLQILTNTVTSSDGDALYVSYNATTADNAVITGNKLSPYPGGDGIDISYGNGAQITSNAITFGYEGVYVHGVDNPRVSLNTILTTQAEAVFLNCYDAHPPSFPGDTPCTGGLVDSNKGADIGASNYPGFTLYNDAAGGQTSGTFTVVSNSVARAGDECYYVNGNLMTLTLNTGSDCGMANYAAGFSVNGTHQTVTSNTITRASADGFAVNTSDTVTTTTLQGNTSDHAGEDGFDVHASRVSLIGNKALFSNGVGFEVEAGNTTVSMTGANTATSNALGACLATGTTTQSGNAFGTPDTPAACDKNSGYIGN